MFEYANNINSFIKEGLAFVLSSLKASFEDAITLR